jgi:hypothetical protein
VRETRGLPAMGMGSGIPEGRFSLPLRLPVPLERVWVFVEYGYGYPETNPRVTRADHYMVEVVESW